MSTAAGIWRQGVVELDDGSRRRPPLRRGDVTDVVAALGVDADTAAKGEPSRWAADGWLRRARRGLYIGVPVDAAARRPGPRTLSMVAAAVLVAVLL